MKLEQQLPGAGSVLFIEARTDKQTTPTDSVGTESHFSAAVLIHSVSNLSTHLLAPFHLSLTAGKTFQI